MEKRYQVFLSSTYADLKDERTKVIQTLMEMDCIPAGMEIFPAIDDTQLDFIKKIIDDSDYYILIIGGRYGSLSIDGLSYTEKEYDYAKQKGIKILAFLHKNPAKLSVEKSDIEPQLRQKLEEFRNKVSTNRLVKFWDNPEELPGLVSLSLNKTIKTYPAVGWVRATTIASAELLAEMNELRKKNEYFAIHDEYNRREKEANLQIIDILTNFHERFVIRGSFTTPNDPERTWEATLSLREVFFCVASKVRTTKRSLRDVQNDIMNHLQKPHDHVFTDIDDADFEIIRIRLVRLGLIKAEKLEKVKGNYYHWLWSLTNLGKAVAYKIHAID